MKGQGTFILLISTLIGLFMLVLLIPVFENVISPVTAMPGCNVLCQLGTLAIPALMAIALLVGTAFVLFARPQNQEGY